MRKTDGYLPKELDYATGLPPKNFTYSNPGPD
jgi:hypothetical protein